MKDLLYQYKNGNYNVELFSDGTKIRRWDGNIKNPQANFPESIDLKITNKCDLGCEFCHEKSTASGGFGNLKAEFLNTLHPGTELALGGGNVFEMVDHGLEDFLWFLKERHIFPSMTINQYHLLDGKFYKNKTAVDHLVYWINNDLVYGIGISYNGNEKQLAKAVQSIQAKCYKNIKDNIVVHLINGIHSKHEIESLLGKGYKALMLGYKDFGRGHKYFEKYGNDIKINKSYNYKNIHKLIKGFKVLSFDNLAIDQLNLRRIFLKDQWDEFYMGDDGSHTMYIDLVKGEYGVSSASDNRYQLTNNINEMFRNVKAVSENSKNRGGREMDNSNDVNKLMDCMDLKIAEIKRKEDLNRASAKESLDKIFGLRKYIAFLMKYSKQRTGFGLQHLCANAPGFIVSIEDDFDVVAEILYVKNTGDRSEDLEKIFVFIGTKLDCMEPLDIPNVIGRYSITLTNDHQIKYFLCENNTFNANVYLKQLADKISGDLYVKIQNI